MRARCGTYFVALVFDVLPTLSIGTRTAPKFQNDDDGGGDDDDDDDHDDHDDHVHVVTYV